MRTPSDRLKKILTEQDLCTGAELVLCEPYVRRLCHDLPDFDSVWLDALVQQRFLTAWQADRLQADTADAVVVGRFQRQRALGQSTYLATDEEQRQQFVLRQVPTGNAVPTDQRIEELLSAIDRLRSTIPAALTVPQEVVASVPSVLHPRPGQLLGWRRRGRGCGSCDGSSTPPPGSGSWTRPAT